VVALEELELVLRLDSRSAPARVHTRCRNFSDVGGITFWKKSDW
jgi:hypothetical protein